jgi:hypothetical protein
MSVGLQLDPSGGKSGDVDERRELEVVLRSN